MSKPRYSPRSFVHLMRIRGLTVSILVLASAVALYAAFPGISYDFWVDFEQAALNVAPTTSTLASSSHGATGTWRITNANGGLTVVSKAQDGLAGATGNRGLQYSDATGRPSYVSWSLPSAKASVSIGLWYCTSTQSASGYNFQEGPHFAGFANNATGDLWRLSDERSSFDNTRWIRLSPSSQPNSRAIPVTDNTCYWITMKYVAGGTTTFNLYDSSLKLLGSVNSNGTGINDTASVTSIFLGNDQKTTASLPYTNEIDDLIVDYTAANFPLLPSTAPPVSGAVPTFGQNGQHTSVYTPAPQDLASVHWSAPLNVSSPSTAHVAVPVITAANTVVVPAASSGGFQLNAYTGLSGSPLYTLSTDYILPSANWQPVYQPVLTLNGPTPRLYYACAGGTICYISNPDANPPGTPVRQVFYTSLTDYQSRSASFNSTVFVNTPIAADANGNIFFGFRVQGTAPTPLSTSQDGFARIDANGNASYVLASVAAGDTAIGRDSHNAAPGLSNDQSTVYVVVKSASTEYYGYLLGLDSTTLATKYKVLLVDPVSGSGAGILDDSTSSPTIGPDNDVYIGVAANPDDGSRGFLLHFSGDLSKRQTPGAFGWDSTASVVPASAVPSYTGTSTYLLLSNYNNFAGLNDGNGVNRLALLDPDATQVDPDASAKGLTEMREVLTATGPTPDALNVSLGSTNAVLPWQTNAIAVNAAANSIFAIGADGRVYRWDLSKNSLSQFLTLGPALSQPYVPTAIGPDGTVFAIYGTTLYALGNVPGVSVRVTSSIPDDRSVSAGQSLTFTATVANTGTGSTPTGSVTFSDTTYAVAGSSLIPTTTQLATVSLSSGQAAFTSSSLSAGKHFISASYSGDANFAAATGSFVQSVHSNATSTSVTATPSLSSLGQAVIVSAKVTAIPPGAGIPTGMVLFKQGNTILGQAPLDNSGQTSFTTTTLQAGANTITAIYSSDSTFASSQGSATATVVSSLNTSTSVTVSPNPSSAGQTITITATVSSSGGTPTGTVTFTDGSTTLASNLAVNGSGQVSYSTAALAVGSHTITADFTGTGGWLNSNGTTTTQVVESGFLTSTVVTSAPNPSTFGQAVTITAMVSSSGGSATGAVTFMDGNTTLASNVALNGAGQASYTTTTLAVGSHTFTASFTGTGGFSNSSGTSATQVVQNASSSFPGIAYDMWIDFEQCAAGSAPTASCLASSTHGAPGSWSTANSAGGSSLTVQSTAQDTLAGASGSRGFQYNTNSIVVSYETWAPPTAKTQMSLGFWMKTSTQPTSNYGYVEGPHFLGFGSDEYGDLWRLSDERDGATNNRQIRVSPASGAGSAVTVADATMYWVTFRMVKNGPVQLNVYDTGLNLLGSVSFTDALNTNIDYLWIGNDQSENPALAYTELLDDLIVDYTNATFPLLPATSNATATSVTAAPNPSTFGQSVTITATVSSSAGTPTGSATFMDGSTTLASNVAVNGSGQASYTTTSLAVGSHTITASFTGTGGFGNSTGTTTQTVNPVLITTTTAVTVTPSPSTFGQSVTMTATVSSGSGTPTGTVTFTDGTTTLAPNVVVNGSGQATYTTTTLTTGSHTITASFTGTNGFTNSSGTGTQTVSPAPSTTSLAATPNPSTFGQSVTITATVTSSGGTPTGTVTFVDGSTTLASNVAVNGSGIATYATTTLAVGSHTIAANFTGTGGFADSSGTVTQTVNAATTTTTVAGSPNPSTLGQSVTLTASVSSPGGTPTGAVTFLDGATTLAANIVVNGSGQATYTTTALAVGSHTVTANFTATGNFANSSGTLTQTVNAASTTTTVAAAPNPSNSGDSVTITATVTSAAGVPTGAVTFMDGATTLASNVAVNGSGQATYTTTALAVGSHTISANFTGTGGFANSTGAMTQTVNTVTVATTTAVASVPNPSTFGQSVTFTATVSSSNGTPTGTMTFMDGSTTLATNVALNGSGLAAYTTSTLAVGSHAITANFTGTGGFANSTGTVTQTVNAAVTTTTVAATPNPSTFGQSVAITATVSSGGGTPTGTVTFMDGSTTLASNVAVNANGLATYTTTTLAVGSHAITANFTGTGGFANSTGTVTQTVNTATTTTTAAATPNPSTFGQSVAITATVSSGGGTPTGTVTFMEGSTALASNVSVNGAGQATYTTTTLVVGSHTITANFTGTGNFGNSSGTTTQTVNTATTATAVTASPNPSSFGDSVTITATTISSGGTPTGTVTFVDGSTTLASNVPVNGNGQATYTTTSLAVGSHTIAANFTGAGGFGNSTGSVVQTVNAVTIATTTTVTATPNPSTFGQSVTFTATISSGNGTPTGTVTFTDGSTTLASNVAVNGSAQASYTTASLTVGSHTITAAFTGTGSYGSSSGTSAQLINAVATATAATATPNPSTFGQSVTFTATISSSTGTPTGTVTFMDGATTLASNVAVNGSGQATYTTTSLAVGSHTITVNFTGTGGFANSTGSVTQTVNTAATTTTVAATPNPSTFGQSVTITASVTSAGGTPTGTVTFSDGSTTLASNVTLNGSGQATYTTATLAFGSHTITASFTGAGNFANSAGTVTQTVNAAATNTTAAATPNPSTFGQAVTITATITSSAGTPTGTVNFVDGSTTLASNVAVNASGQASYTTASLAVGSHTITASFTGSGGFANSAGTVTEIVNAVTITTATAVTSTPNPSTFGQSVTITATVTSGGGVPTGAVTFTDGGTTLASNVPVNGSGQATYTTTSLAIGSHTIAATFAGTGGFGSSSGSITQVVQSSAGGFPGITYDMWTDFEQCAVAAAPTASCLASSTHGAAGTWSTTNDKGGGSLTVQSSAQDGLSGAPGNRGFQYNTSGTIVSYDTWTPSGAKTQMSVGFWFKTSSQPTPTYSYVEGPHFFGFSSNSQGDLWRLSDERDSATNTRQIRVSPRSGPGTSVTVADATTYWIAFRMVKGGPVQLNVYDTKLNLVGSVSFTDTNNANINYIWIGNDQTESPALAYMEQLDDLVVDYTNAKFPLLPVIANATITTLTATPNPSTPGQAVNITATVTATGGTPTGTVTFMDGGTTLASNVAVDGNGQATFSSSSFALGTHTITASFTGTNGWFNSNGSIVAQVVDTNFLTGTTVLSSPNPSTFGQSVSITATVTAAGGTPTGTMTFMDGNTTLASNVAVNANGQATFTTTALATGSHTITASFAGTGGYGNSSGIVAQTVQADTTAPSQPTGLIATSGPATAQISLAWSASTDNVAVTSYQVWRASTLNGTYSRIATVVTTSYLDTLSRSGLTRFYYVIAQDAAGNLSTRSATVSAASR